ncbi:hypothetical protein IMG5_197560 [Ichthyophthirius multifiliis]|uniref:Transmembrane protein n=1 Tax=Ichthyophthirius multifiliis TaxID=5932 RepID=G0R5B7_ICHMU|nr:hypothetical protein IMG5_197560 [Ichthyophthirius multifiliis]EGR27341.1 hypothetical protein IMG5_197560 [Ichthyophthirius multifiliis]|eukprot:XP_004024225.1 hypothetical protein IMG5_197560 [Ichthyophthirius multifiliis]
MQESRKFIIIIKHQMSQVIIVLQIQMANLYLWKEIMMPKGIQSQIFIQKNVIQKDKVNAKQMTKQNKSFNFHFFLLFFLIKQLIQQILIILFKQKVKTYLLSYQQNRANTQIFISPTPMYRLIQGLFMKFQILKEILYLRK